MCFLQKLKEKKYDEFLVNEKTAFAHLRLINDHITHWQSIMLPADPKYIGTAIEMCASTFGCDVPNELGLKIPLVVRLEGTNVELGKKIMADSGLAIISADNLGEAAEKIVAAVRGDI